MRQKFFVIFLASQSQHVDYQSSVTVGCRNSSKLKKKWHFMTSVMSSIEHFVPMRGVHFLFNRSRMLMFCVCGTSCMSDNSRHKQEYYLLEYVSHMHYTLLWSAYKSLQNLHKCSVLLEVFPHSRLIPHLKSISGSQLVLVALLNFKSSQNNNFL